MLNGEGKARALSGRPRCRGAIPSPRGRGRGWGPRAPRVGRPLSAPREPALRCPHLVAVTSGPRGKASPLATRAEPPQTPQGSPPPPPLRPSIPATSRRECIWPSPVPICRPSRGCPLKSESRSKRGYRRARRRRGTIRPPTPSPPRRPPASSRPPSLPALRLPSPGPEPEPAAAAAAARGQAGPGAEGETSVSGPRRSRRR